jgi:hypothetical protein
MGFDDDVDAARERLEAAVHSERAPRFDSLAALARLLPQIAAAIQSRRLSFELIEDDDEPTIEIVHAPSEEALGFVMADEGEYVFESNLFDYFEDFVDPDPASFVLRLYETLRADLAKYEFELKG